MFQIVCVIIRARSTEVNRLKKQDPDNYRIRKRGPGCKTSCCQPSKSGVIQHLMGKSKKRVTSCETCLVFADEPLQKSCQYVLLKSTVPARSSATIFNWEFWSNSGTLCVGLYFTLSYKKLQKGCKKLYWARWLGLDFRLLHTFIQYRMPKSERKKTSIKSLRTERDIRYIVLGIVFLNPRK